MNTNRAPIVGIVLLNWNRWGRTIACLESVFRLDYPDFFVVVCDNDSSDGSTAHLKAWAEGRQSAELPEATELRSLVDPAVAKPVAHRVLDRAAAESGQRWARVPLTLIPTGGNLGFAGGCNVGARHALDQGADFVWFLNNDTLVPRDSLTALIREAKAHPDVALCGSTLLSLRHPHKVLALGGGRLHRKGTTTHLGEGQSWPADGAVTKAAREAMDYVVGASMLARRRFMEQAGLMDEGYFLYYEELDWARRLPHGMRLGYAADSVVYHVEGGTTGGLLLRYYYRSLIRFTWRHHRAFLPWVLAHMLLRVLEALVRRDGAKLRALGALVLPSRVCGR